MKKMTNLVYLSSRNAGSIEGPSGYHSEITDSLPRAPVGTDLAYEQGRHSLLPPPNEGLLVLFTSQKQDEGSFAFSRLPIPPGQGISQPHHPCMLHAK